MSARSKKNVLKVVALADSTCLGPVRESGRDFCLGITSENIRIHPVDTASLGRMPQLCLLFTVTPQTCQDMAPKMN